ncbi:urease accessory protein UreF [Roseovarius aestuariivivens]|uniref:urease accessory protein UreF n=1 Tax=Roseovarius aestuariivivens TaxID=1888910 RepID=UPI001FD8B8E1|nr:urease accessory UreF family protein [Roseovarius aestuariivivens]
MVTATEQQILTLTQWFSPAYPVGAFHFSHGLEWEITQGGVNGADRLERWIWDVLCNGAGRNDAILLAAAYQAKDADALRDVEATARALAGTAERRRETQEMGAAFARITGALTGREAGAYCYPVAVGCAARAEGLPQVLTAQMFLQSFVSNLASVGMRLGSVGQTEGQAIIAKLSPQCLKVAETTASGDLDDLGGAVFAGDIAAMRHETQYSRVFRT